MINLIEDSIDAIFFCFSTDSINSIKELPSLIQCVQNINIKNSSKSGFVFVGTKFDLGIIMSPSDKNRILEKVSKLSRSLHIPIILTSAKSNSFIDEMKNFIKFSAENDYSIQQHIYDSMEKNSNSSMNA